MKHKFYLVKTMYKCVQPFYMVVLVLKSREFWKTTLQKCCIHNPCVFMLRAALGFIKIIFLTAIQEDLFVVIPHIFISHEKHISTNSIIRRFSLLFFSIGPRKNSVFSIAAEAATAHRFSRFFRGNGMFQKAFSH